MNSDRLNAFWRYNKTLFLRFLTAVFFSAILFIGLAIALLSVETLLEFDIPEIRYFQLFLILAGLFNTWFFLAGIPSSIEAFSSSHTYPKGLKVFTQNILIPLVIIYLSILYLYTGKILLQRFWPEGWIAYLVLSFSITGMLALLLLHPIRNQSENQWIQTFSNSFFLTLIPLVVLLMLAILRRIFEYSFTVERYFVLLLGLWLACIVVYFLISKKKSIKVIPASLCALSFLISFGPWGAFAVSERSQIDRLETYLTQNGILQQKVIQPINGEVPFEDRRQISNIIRYLNSNHGLGGIQPWFDTDFDSLHTQVTESSMPRPVDQYSRPQYVIKLMGIEYVDHSASIPENTLRNEFFTEYNNIIKADETHYFIRNINWSENQHRQIYHLPDGPDLVIESNSEAPHIRIYLAEHKESAIEINIRNIIDNLAAHTPAGQSKLAPEDMTFIFTSERFTSTLYFESILWSYNDDKRLIRSIYMAHICLHQVNPQ